MDNDGPTQWTLVLGDTQQETSMIWGLSQPLHHRTMQCPIEDTEPTIPSQYDCNQ